MEKQIIKKAVDSARYFKNKGEVDMWHSIWHNGKPYDYHLYAEYDYEKEKDICIMVIYEVLKLKDDTYEVNIENDLYVHQFKGLPKHYHEEYKFNLEEYTCF